MATELVMEAVVVVLLDAFGFMSGFGAAGLLAAPVLARGTVDFLVVDPESGLVSVMEACLDLTSEVVGFLIVRDLVFFLVLEGFFIVLHSFIRF